MATIRRRMKNNHRLAKTNKRKYTYRTKKSRNRTTRKIGHLGHIGGMRVFPKSPAKTRWGKRIEKLIIQKIFHDDERLLNEVLALPANEPNDVPSRFYVDKTTGKPTNINIKAKQNLTSTGHRTIDTGLPKNILDGLRDEVPYHMILIDYKIDGNHMSPDKPIRLDLKKIFRSIFGNFTQAEKDKLYRDIEEVSSLIKSKKDDAKARNLSLIINNTIAAKSQNKEIIWKINPKISSSNQRLQSSLSFNLDSPFIKSCIITNSEADTPSSAESFEEVSPTAWMSPVDNSPKQGMVKLTQTSRARPKPISIRKISPVVKVTPAPAPASAEITTSSRSVKRGISKRNRFSRSKISERDVENLMLEGTQFTKPSTMSRRRPEFMERLPVLKEQEEEASFVSTRPSSALPANAPRQSFMETTRRFFEGMNPNPADTDMDDE